MTTGLTGMDARLAFDGRQCRMDYSPSSGGWLRRRLGRIAFPVTALAGVQLTPPGRRRLGRLTLLLRQGADPFYAVAGAMISADDHPFFVEFPPEGEADAQRLAETLHGAVVSTGLAQSAAGEFMVEAAWPPAVETYDGTCHFDGRNVRLDWKAGGEGRTFPLAALDAVTCVHGQGRRGDFLWFRAVGERADLVPDPRDGERCLPFASERAEVLLFAAGVATALRGRQLDLNAPPADGGLPHGLSGVGGPGGAGVVLHGLHGRAEFDGARVIVSSQGMTRAIPLAAVDQVELVEANGGVGHVRVRLAGTAGDRSAPDPSLDVDAVLHNNDPAALEFTLQVTRALQGVTRVPDSELLRTAGLRPDVGEALARASGRVRAMARELAALSAALEPGETVREIELAVGRRVLVFFLTDRHLLSMGPDDALGGHTAVPLHMFADVRATWDETHEGNLVWIDEEGDEIPFHGIYHPVRFQQTFRALRFGAYGGQEPGAPSPAYAAAPGAGPHTAAPKAGPHTGAPAGTPQAPPMSPAPPQAGRPDVAAALSRTRSDVSPFQRELAALLGVLDAGEPVKEVEPGRWGGKAGLLALTDRRAVFADQEGGLNALAFTDIDYVSYDTDYDGSPGRLTATDNDYDTIEFTWLREPERFAHAIDAMRQCPPERVPAPAGVSPDAVRARPDVAAALSRSRAGDQAGAQQLLLLGAGLGPGDQLYELEPALFAGENGLLALTGRAVLFAGPGGLRRVPLPEVAGVRHHEWRRRGDEDLHLETGSGSWDLVFRLRGGERFEAAIHSLLAGSPVRPSPAGPGQHLAAEPAGPASPYTAEPAGPGYPYAAEPEIGLSDVSGWLGGIAEAAARLTQLVNAQKNGLLTEAELNAKCAGPLADGERFEAAVDAYLAGTPVWPEAVRHPGRTAASKDEVRAWVGRIGETAAKLGDLVRLRQDGLLTAEEFAAKCAELRRR
ncbi:DUF4429 domain-containing protein [Actinoallomurus soli]|uniref:DUF4429 domain-containing protein n=1 Tax=Actinoallomurus soli TaxID=2952535 RepID=UPI00209365DF|nr:DUF4429 domain-containing protein [Actinoallomurus soli]MCO5971603.1 DUF4429 domain-containing protein [Actinoallomurus soli]